MIRWGLVGTGAIANKRVGPALIHAQNSSLVAVCDVRRDAAESLAEKLGVGTVHTQLDDLLEDNQIDAVYLATPIFLHASQALQVLDAGKHVLVEKPMALSVAEAEQMVNKAREKGKTLATAYYRRFYPKIERLKTLINEGTLGDIVSVVSTYHTWYDPGEGAPGSWRTQKAQAGGGVIWDMGSHRFDLLIDLLGMPTQVWAVTETLAHDYQVEDTASVYLKMGNGAQCVSTWQWSSRTWVDHLSIIGTKGKVVLEPVDSPNLTLFIGKDRAQERLNEEIPLPDNVHEPMIQNFIDSVLAGVDPVEVGEEGLKVNRILEAIDRSSANGCLVTLKITRGFIS